jgi:uncharacterized membrane-anchored protein YhcB (DUF1043 family)
LCVVCQSSGASNGPLGIVGHLSVCASLPQALQQEPHALQRHMAPSGSTQLSSSMAATGNAGGSRPAVQAAGQLTATSLPEAQAASDSRQQQEEQLASQQQQEVRASGPDVCGGGATTTAQNLIAERFLGVGPCCAGAVDWQPGVHVHSCGHVMHATCFRQWR